MSSSSWPRDGKRPAPAARRRTQTSPRQRASRRPRLEVLEDRRLPSTLTVTSTRDSGSGSLRAEIAAAQGGDTIVFSPKLFHGKATTITLTGGELDLTEDLTIQGPGAGQLTISGNWGGLDPTIHHGRTTGTTPPSRVFEVAQNATVTLSGLTISNGDGVASAGSDDGWNGYGGGILNHGTLTISGCAVSDSVGASEGGGLFSDGTLTVNGCTVSGNRALYGGGIYNAGTGTLTSSTVSSNDAQDLTSDSYFPGTAGGGIFNRGTLMVGGCTVSGNDASFGGGIDDADGTLTVDDGEISGNSATGHGDGGGLYIDGGTVMVSGCTVSRNSADSSGTSDGGGGGIYVDGGTVTISGCTVSGNSATYAGGGIDIIAGTMTVENSSRIAGNTAGGLGADVCNLGVLYLDGTSTVGILDGDPAILIS